ncbi:hypothetical protein BBK36DRAFT_1197323 [Trichoderma citrinoviride]|uniref:AAA+ ATPase domain-containing protein n=1 Tax=Trichoderma citrinoviride TaxID=58853 RepID=A0A2T4BE73_9HYPO|nr:hypothetical protein BBK36DRAFT_1197323 [Trichoderma citrinoviride]PTB67626.1 hypothetical protein BBK36DRAFT_1197323 [Trichoderma citrinoviride]
MSSPCSASGSCSVSVSSASASSSPSSGKASSKESILAAHLALLSLDGTNEDAEELAATPIFTQAVLDYGAELKANGKAEPFAQYGLLAGILEESDAATIKKTPSAHAEKDVRLFFNTTAPSSVFICGSQGSGKSHSLSCLLENFLTQSKANVLPRPLTGIVFHYDPFGGSPCEAAYLASAKDISVRVLCAPTNIRDIKAIYAHLPDVVVEELRINQSDLDTRKMMELMAVSSVQGSIPLYLHVIQRILKDLRIEEQLNGTTFNYREFKRRLLDETLAAGQLVPLQQRLDNLESFMVKEQVVKVANKKALQSQGKGNSWESKAGQLTIVDLSCPCVTEETACSLFNICLDLFLQHRSDTGLVIALDEAHKYMTDTVESAVLTAKLLENIRVQRHLGIRVIISTQEPTISPKLLDLCSTTIVHRFTSPDWMQALKRHLAGASIAPLADIGDEDEDDDYDYKVVKPALTAHELATELFTKIVALRRGEALLFCPSAIIDVRRTGTESEKKNFFANGGGGGGVKVKDEHEERKGNPQLVKLSHGHMKVRVRERVTRDGGRSVVAR